MKHGISNKLEQKALIKTSYDKRNVRYEVIHNFNPNYYDSLVPIGVPKQSSKILDHGCGYGSLTKRISQLYPDLQLKFDLQDTSAYQILRAKKELKDLKTNNKFNYYLNALTDCYFDNNEFDIVFSKLVLQEMHFDEQIQEVCELRRILKNEKFMFLWLIWLEQPYKDFFRKVITEKDKIAGLKTLVENRYFADNKEILSILRRSGFTSEKTSFIPIPPLVWETKNQLVGDLLNDQKKHIKLNRFIENEIKKETIECKRSIKYSKNGDNIKFEIPQMVIKLKK
ncbi:MAG: class I SAM-dependent methyltransferase [Candidatus Woesearchaeota archaeon]